MSPLRIVLNTSIIDQCICAVDQRSVTFQQYNASSFSTNALPHIRLQDTKRGLVPIDNLLQDLLQSLGCLPPGYNPLRSRYCLRGIGCELRIEPKV